MKDKFNNQFATQRLRTEMSNTSAGPGTANVVPSQGIRTGEQAFPRATKKVVKKKLRKKEKDVETKLAAGKSPKIPGDWTNAPSIPNRSSDMFDYKKILEAENTDPFVGRYIKLGRIIYKVENRLENGDYNLKADGYETTSTEDALKRYFRFIEAVSDATGIEEEDLVHAKRTGGYDSVVISDIPNSDKTITVDSIGNKLKIHISGPTYSGYKEVPLNENYSRFKKETQTRTNEQQLHAAMRLAERKIQEANRILEYTSQLRTELNETRVNKNTQRLMEKITRGIAEAYGKMKKMK